jgi:hypothetical protein
VNITLDIETIPAQRPDALAEIRESLQAKLTSDIEACKPPGNYKKQETIDAWMAEEKPKAVQALRDCFEADVDAAYRKTGLDGAFGQICVIGFALDDEAPFTYQGTDEVELLHCFGCHLTDRVRASDIFSATVIGHNVASFDLRFLQQRSIVNGVRPHSVISRAAQAKPWETEKVFDTMVQWAGVGNRITLDKLCKALSIPTPKGEIDGSKVWDYVKAGKLSEVAEYCKGDVAATREAYRRMTFQTVAHLSRIQTQQAA